MIVYGGLPKTACGKAAFSLWNCTTIDLWEIVVPHRNPEHYVPNYLWMIGPTDIQHNPGMIIHYVSIHDYVPSYHDVQWFLLNTTFPIAHAIGSSVAMQDLLCPCTEPLPYIYIYGGPPPPVRTLSVPLPVFTVFVAYFGVYFFKRFLGGPRTSLEPRTKNQDCTESLGGILVVYLQEYQFLHCLCLSLSSFVFSRLHSFNNI